MLRHFALSTGEKRVAKVWPTSTGRDETRAARSAIVSRLFSHTNALINSDLIFSKKKKKNVQAYSFSIIHVSENIIFCFGDIFRRICNFFFILRLISSFRTLFR